jgi:hypothetical protein
MRHPRVEVALGPMRGIRRCAQNDKRMATRLLDDGVEAVGENSGAHGVGVFAVREGAYLDVEKLVLRLVADGDCVALFLE